MSYPTVRIATSSPTRQRTPAAWRGLLEAYDPDPTLGSLKSNDFTVPRVQTVGAFIDGFWLAEDDVAGATAEAFDTASTPAAAAADGVATVAGTTGTDNQAVKIHAGHATTAGEIIRLPSDIVDARGDVVFETRVYLNTAEADQYFIGLAVPAAVVLASGLIGAAQSVLGFLRTDAGDLTFVARNDNAGGTAVADAVTIVAAADIPEDDWVKLCFRHNKDNTVEIYVDEVRILKDTSNVDIVIDPLALPEVAVARTISVGRGATGDNATVAIPVDFLDVYVAE